MKQFFPALPSKNYWTVKRNLQTRIVERFKFSCLLAVLFCIFTMQAGAQTPYTITWTGLTNNVVAQGVPTGITVTQQYNGVVPSCNTSSNGATTSYSAKLTAAAGYTFTITSIGGAAYASNAGSRNFSVKLDNGSFSGTGPVTSIGSSSSCGGNTALTPYSIPAAGQNVATATTITITVLRAPGSASGGGYSWTRSLTVTGVVSPIISGNTIATSAVTTSLCAGAAVSVPFTATGTFTSGNDFTAQLSNAAGSFVSPVNIGTFTGTASGTISTTIPVGTTAGSGYRIRVISSTPSVTGTDNGANIAINAAVISSVSAAAAPGTTICAGTPVTFTATPTNGGATPTYKWFKNTVQVGAGVSYNAGTTLTNGDVIKCEMTSNATCVSPAMVTSNTLTMTVNPDMIPSVTVAGAPGSTICAGTPVTFTATDLNAGSTPTFSWFKNNVSVGTNSNIYTDNSLSNNDDIFCIVTTSSTCASDPDDTSNNIVMVVNPILIPSATISVSPNDTICNGTNSTFTVLPVNGGSTPQYQWEKNGTSIPTETNPTYTSGTLVNGDKISCVITSNAVCANPATVNSDTIRMEIKPLLTPSVTVAANPGNTICAGTSVTFTATPTNEGTTPSYQWKKNNVNVGTNSAIYTDNTLTNGNVITVVMTSNATCAIPATATSTGITMTVNPLLTPTVTIAANPGNTICAGTPVTFTATPTNGGTTPIYQWKKNTINVGINNATYTDNALVNGDIITVVMTSNAICPTPAAVTSTGITMTVNPLLTPSATITANPGNTICAGASVTFTAVPTNGGTTPSYQWKKNNVNVGTNSSTYITNTLVHNDIINLVITSSATCASPTTGASNLITMTVNALLTPSVILALSPKDTVCEGTTINFTTTGANQGSAPTYVWRRNGGVISGATASSYSTSTSVNGDVISVTMSSSATCASPVTATDDTTIIVNPLLLPTLKIFATPDTIICSGTQASFSVQAVNAGTNPQYQWKLNNINMIGATSSIYMLSNLNTGDVVSCDLTSNATCATPATVNSINKLKFSVGSTTPPAVTVVASPGNVINPGQEVTFFSTVANSSIAPVYKWYKNGLEIPGVTGTSFKTTDILVNDVVYLVVYSSDVCSQPDSGKSNSLQFTVTNNVANASVEKIQFEVFPNPNNGSFAIKGETGLAVNANMKFEVIDNIGRLVFNDSINNSTASFERNFSLSNLAAGTYYLRVSINEKTAFKRIVIK
jgi:hypothetical protein